MSQITNGTYEATSLEKLDFKKGYAVGMIQGSAYVVTDEARVRPLMRATALRYLPKYVGIWTDEDGVHIDPVRVIYDLQRALTVGRDNNQKCIWDFKNEVEIPCD